MPSDLLVYTGRRSSPEEHWFGISKPTHNATFEQPGYTDSAVILETPYEIPCQHIPTHVNVNNGMRQASVGMDSSEAVYDMPPALDDMNDDDDNCYSVVGPTDSNQPNLQHQGQHLTVSCDDSGEYSHLQHKYETVHCRI